MLRALIIEDEGPALRRLTSLLASADPKVSVLGTADSLAAATRWFAANPPPDLVFADIQLGDGLSVDLFRRSPPPAPVIFTTAHDAFLLEAFAAHGIAYLLKPVKPAELAAALAKHAELGRQYAKSPGGVDFAALAQALAASAKPAGRRRILAQKGNAHVPVSLEDVAYFFSADKLTFLMTRGGERALVNEPLATLEAELDGAEFFRLNRNFLARAGAVRSYTSVGKGRLAVQLAPPAPEEVQVSQERAAEFKAWVSDAPRRS
jgi:DNA-binding LytR/AlgR family response regulator